MKIEDMNFSVRTYNCLKRGKIDTVEQLRETSDEDLMAIRCFGIACLKEVHEKLGRDSGCKNTCGGDCKCQTSSAEKKAIFRLGQMDMQESIIAMIQNNQDAAPEEMIQMIRRLEYGK